MEKEEKFPFENTELYKRSLNLARLCRKICNMLPKGYFSDADQLRRASLSVCNNFAEGYGRWHVKDKRQFYSIARGSAYECVPMITLLHEEKFIKDDQLKIIRSHVGEVTKMLSGMIQGLEKRK